MDEEIIGIRVGNIGLPNIPLSNYDIIEAVKQLKIKNFRGVFLRDNLPKKVRKNECGIINLADSDDLNGTHWECYFKKDKKKIYFDSYGLIFPTELGDYLGEDIEFNTLQIQYRNTVICEHLCLYMLSKLSKGEDFIDIIQTLLL